MSMLIDHFHYRPSTHNITIEKGSIFSGVIDKYEVLKKFDENSSKDTHVIQIAVSEIFQNSSRVVCDFEAEIPIELLKDVSYSIGDFVKFEGEHIFYEAVSSSSIPSEFAYFQKILTFQIIRTAQENIQIKNSRIAYFLAVEKL